VKVFEKSCVIENIKSDLYSCNEIKKIEPVNITKYKGFNICAKRSNQTLADLQVDIRNYIRKNLSNSTKPYPDTVMKEILWNFPNFLNEAKPIIDIKFLNTTIWSEKEVKDKYNFDLTDYEKIPLEPSDGTGYNAYIKRLDSKKIKSIYDYNSLIVNIHTYNEIICAFNDIGPPKNKMANFQKDKIQLGFEYCDKFYYYSDLFYNDNYRRSQSIHFPFDTTKSKKDYFVGNQIDEVYKNNSMESILKYEDETVEGIFEPNLIYENYIYGQGCPQIDKLETHINYLYIEKYLVYIAMTLIAIKCLLATSFGFMILTSIVAKLNSYLIYAYISTLVIIVLTGLTALLYSIYGQIYQESFNFVQTNCQYNILQDTISADKTIPLERKLNQYLEEQLQYAYLIAFSYFVETVIFTNLFIYFLLYETEDNKEGEEKLNNSNPDQKLQQRQQSIEMNTSEDNDNAIN